MVYYKVGVITYQLSSFGLELVHVRYVCSFLAIGFRSCPSAPWTNEEHVTESELGHVYLV